MRDDKYKTFKLIIRGEIETKKVRGSLRIIWTGLTTVEQFQIAHNRNDWNIMTANIQWEYVTCWEEEIMSIINVLKMYSDFHPNDTNIFANVLGLGSV